MSSVSAIHPVLIQARLASTRLPGKILFTFNDEPIIRRICRIGLEIGPVFLLIPETEPAEIFTQAVHGLDVQIITGPEKNVLARFQQGLQAAQKLYDFTHFYRLTADNYLMQPQLIKKMIADDFARYDYIAPPVLSGFLGEFISVQVFENYLSSPSPDAVEHVTWDIRRSDNINRLDIAPDVLGIKAGLNRTLDTLDDLIRLKLEEKLFADMPLDCLIAINRLPV